VDVRCIAYNKNPDNNHTYTHIHSTLYVAIKHPPRSFAPSTPLSLLPRGQVPGTGRGAAPVLFLQRPPARHEHLRIVQPNRLRGLRPGEVQEFARALLASLPLEPAAAAAPDAGDCCVAVIGAAYLGK
jgi:hypothetical protein